jgi:hypothetical protein
MSAACRYEGCTVGETGACALERDPATCENRIGNAFAATEGAAGADTLTTPVSGDESIGAPVLEGPVSSSSFPSSRTLGPEAIEEMMSSRYVTVVGILGDPESGKTACLASLYLLVSNANLEGWSFADSRSLMAFDDIARGARDWNEGQPPEQMTVHTEMADDRRPGFLHLRLVRESDGRRVDFALPDLPGEWTKTFVRTARSDRLEFMKSAEAIWVVVDGRALADREQRQGLITRLGQLAGRIRALRNGAVPRLLIVVTHRDLGEVDASVASRIATELAKHQVAGEIVPVAPFSDSNEVKAGFGISTLIDATVGANRSAPEFWPSTAPRPHGRSFLRYRRG